MKKRIDDPKARYREYLKGELEAASLYNALADAEREDKRAEIFRELALTEMRHAAHWADRIGVSKEGLKPAATTLRIRLLAGLARRFGTRSVLPWLLRGEATDQYKYSQEPEGRLLVGDEKSHARTLKTLSEKEGEGKQPAPEGAHRANNAANLRAAVLGGNDGLVSNFALTMGVAGGTSDSHIILLTGLAGLLAGSFSMAAGEYVSVRAQVDVYKRDVEIEMAEMEESPEQEKEELVQIYKSKGLTSAEAEVVAERIMADPKVALDTMVREELGFDPDNLGSPWGVAISSFVAFSVGAIIPVIPRIFMSGNSATIMSAIFGGIALLVVGGILGLLSNRNMVWGSVRMLLIGAASAAVTFTIGRLIGTSLT